MKRIAALILATILGLTLVAPSSASAAEVVVGGVLVKGRILTTGLRAGGGTVEGLVAKFGEPLQPETKLYVSGRNTFHQHFELGTVYWDGVQGGKWWMTQGSKPNIAGVSNDRDALYRYGFKGGMLMRSAKLNYITTNGKRLLVAQMHGGIVLDLRDSGTRDPNFPYVSEIRRGIPGNATRYHLYVTGSDERTGISKALQVLADSPKDAPVWIHCAAGRDRTGVVVALTMTILGSDWGDIYAEYLRTGSAEEENLIKFLDTIADRYSVEKGYPDDGKNGVINYLHDIGVTNADMDNIREKFIAA